MRILHLIPSLSGGGAERQLSYLAPELARLGHEVHIAYSKDGPCRPELPDVSLHQLKVRSNYDPYLLWQVFQLIRHIKPDIIHAWITQMDILGGIAARFNGIPWLFREPSSAVGHTPSVKNSLRVWVGSGAAAIVSNSQGGDEYWESRLPNSRRYVVQNGLPMHEIDGTVASLPPGLEKSKGPIVLYVGRLIASKNMNALLEAMARIRQQQDMAGVICGDGPQRSELEVMRHNLGLDADVHFTGYLPAASVWALMKKATIFVSLSAYEGCPNTVMEAMACGCPLVLSDISAHREICDESCAIFVDPSNIQQTADSITQVLHNTDAAEARALIAKQRTREWSIPTMAKKWEGVYKDSVSNSSPVTDKSGKPTSIEKH